MIIFFKFSDKTFSIDESKKCEHFTDYIQSVIPYLTRNVEKKKNFKQLKPLSCIRFILLSAHLLRFPRKNIYAYIIKLYMIRK